MITTKRGRCVIVKKCKTFGELFAEISKLSRSDKDRLMQCVTCMYNPATCGPDDEDEHGNCKRYEVYKGVRS